MQPLLGVVPGLGFEVRSHAALVVVAIIVCHLVGPRSAERVAGIPSKTTRQALILWGIAAFAVGRVHFLMNHWTLVAETPLPARLLWAGGLHAGGALIGMVLAAPIVARSQGVALGCLSDALVPTIALGIAVARFGCFLRGCCLGTACAWPWCLGFPGQDFSLETTAAGDLLVHIRRVHPLPLYFSGAALAIGAIALWMQRRKRYHGQVSLLSLVAFGVSSALLEFLRAQQPGGRYWASVPQLQWVAIVVAVVATLALAGAELRQLRRRVTWGNSTA